MSIVNKLLTIFTIAVLAQNVYADEVLYTWHGKCGAAVQKFGSLESAKEQMEADNAACEYDAQKIAATAPQRRYYQTFEPSTGYYGGYGAGLATLAEAIASQPNVSGIQISCMKSKGWYMVNPSSCKTITETPTDVRPESSTSKFLPSSPNSVVPPPKETAPFAENGYDQLGLKVELRGAYLAVVDISQSAITRLKVEDKILGVWVKNEGDGSSSTLTSIRTIEEYNRVLESAGLGSEISFGVLRNGLSLTVVAKK